MCPNKCVYRGKDRTRGETWGRYRNINKTMDHFILKGNTDPTSEPCTPVTDEACKTGRLSIFYGLTCVARRGQLLCSTCCWFRNPLLFCRRQFQSWNAHQIHQCFPKEVQKPPPTLMSPTVTLMWRKWNSETEIIMPALPHPHQSTHTHEPRLYKSLWCVLNVVH